MGLLLTSALSLAACVQQPEPEPALLDTIASRSCEELQQEAIFSRRVLPLATEGKAPSCARCHLPGVDFRPFVQQDECHTLACMQQEALVDLTQPEQSKILSWIARGHQQVNRSLEEDPLTLAEHDAFATWITYQAKCQAQVCEPDIENPCNTIPLPVDLPDMPADAAPDQDAPDLAPDLPPADPCDEQEIIAQFTLEVWPWHGRCYHCHADSYSASSRQYPPPPPWMSDDRGVIGARITAERLLQGSYLDLAHPEQSAMLLKPLAEDAGGTPHGGGAKMSDTQDVLYVPLLAWITRVAACQNP